LWKENVMSHIERAGGGVASERTTTPSDPQRPTAPGAGHVMRAEIHQQPSRWAAFLREAAGSLTEARSLLDSRPRFVLFVARGTSDNAALYGSYLVQTTLGLPTGSASPSATTLYGARPDVDGVLVVAISQSGQSPDLLAFVEMARSRGAQVLAVTNVGDSPLAEAAHACLDVMAGPERAVAATKTYTGQLLALLALFGAPHGRRGLGALPEAAAEVLSGASAPVRGLAARYRYATRAVVAGRGYSSASARESALKLAETAYLSAHGYSAADLLHGPMAMLDEQVPLLLFTSAGPDAAQMRDLAGLARERQVDVDVIGDGTVTAGSLPALLPAGLAPEVRPLLEILPAQLLAAELAVSRGHDPDAPRGLQKVTHTL
jgi:glutamine---fructose-6-phosphate transaminase (isomerizing)